MKTENMTKEQVWISVKDQLPELKKKVLVYVSSDNEKLTGLHVGYRMPGNDFWIISGKFSFDVGDVTHWTTLPQFPANGSVAAPKEEPKEKVEKHKKYKGKPNVIQIIDNLNAENASLRDQLRQRDELIKELLPLAESELSNTANVFDLERYRTIISRADSLIKKSQKL